MKNRYDDGKMEVEVRCVTEDGGRLVCCVSFAVSVIELIVSYKINDSYKNIARSLGQSV
jgi:hypothetical protein